MGRNKQYKKIYELTNITFNKCFRGEIYADFMYDSKK
jgi:hypothetical protein